ncbi:hypothetical protein A6M14_05845 [Acinetobacter sp. Ac_877]|uniref:hypothetical protein n=1 Tax=Acinetobacter portensis TaxID=1839785 RepID=UPI00128D856E|nr:hypothetical protein [Acinetobacter portensis]MPW40829.1 hypothetical protein [Acinetobacter portensis]
MEMKESVQQQREMVDVQNKQYEAMNISVEPCWEIKGYHYEETVDDIYEYDEFGNSIDLIGHKERFIVYLDIMNKGKEARKAKIKDNNGSQHFIAEVWEGGEIKLVAIDLSDEDRVRISNYQSVCVKLNFNYKNRYGKNYNKYWQMSIQKNPNGDQIDISYTQIKPLN